MISGWFADDLTLPSWPEKRANHQIVAVGSSSIDKGNDFVRRHLSKAESKPAVYGSYEGVYHDRNVDCVYVGTPNSYHHRDCLDAINAGKHVLCEKPFAMNLAQTQEIFDAARAKGVFVMEGMWTRFFPLTKMIRRLLHEEKAIGEVQRTVCDFALGIGNIDDLPTTSRYRDVGLGAGSLMDIGVYSLTWGLVTLSEAVGERAEEPEVVSRQTLQSGVDTSSTFILYYPSTGRQGILSSTTNVQTVSKDFCRIEGTKGTIVVSGDMTSLPKYFTVKLKGEEDEGEGKRHDFENPGRGFFWEADAVACDIAAGSTQDDTMPWAETVRAMGIMDGIRKRGGAKYAVDQW